SFSTLWLETNSIQKSFSTLWLETNSIQKSFSTLWIETMLVTILSSFLLLRNRNLVQNFPNRLKELWSVWEIRGAVLFSLILQIILILLGKRRKVSKTIKLRVAIWLAYLASDAITSFSLSAISSNSGDTQHSSTEPNLVIMAFWAPFLLLHIGGPDTISAYALEDNELWLRRLLGLGVQLVVAGNVTVRAWTSADLNFLAFPMFVAGIIKYGERIWALWHASRDHFRDSMLPQPDPGPNYATYMEDYSSRREEGFRVSLGPLIEDSLESSNNNISYTADKISSLTEAEFLLYANNFFTIFKRLFADLILSFHDIENSQSFLKSRSYDEAFKVIEIELGFMYDMFYTKAAVGYSLIGGGLRRLVTFSCTIIALLVFFIVEKDAYPIADVIISYLLLIGAVSLEIYAVIVLLCSDWVIVWLHKHNNAVIRFLCRAIFANTPRASKRWSERMEQYNLITFCLKFKPHKFSFSDKILGIYQSLKKYMYKEKRQRVTPELKKLIFQEFQTKLRTTSDLIACKEFCGCRGGWVIEKENCSEALGWSVEVEFDQSILLWHIATDLCYNSDAHTNSDTVNVTTDLHCNSDAHTNSDTVNVTTDQRCNSDAHTDSDTVNVATGKCYNSDAVTNSDTDNVKNCKANSKLLSNYLLYLLVKCPFMLPNGIGQIRFQDT
ncbi:DUF594 family protein, partial [Quillaja saponaria]